MTPQPDSAAHIERDAVIARCRKLELVEDFVRMRREVLRYLAHTPDDAIALSLLARTHFRLGHPVRALAPLVRCCRHSEHFVFRLLYAHALSRVGCAEEALSQLENGARRMPETSLSFFTAGVAFEGIGETERAIRFYTRALELEPGEPSACHRLGRLLLATPQTQRALELLLRAAEGSPDNPNCHLDLSVGLELVGRFEEALSAVEKALTLEPDNLVALHNRSHLLILLNRSTGAVAAAEAALRVQPAYPKTEFTRAMALLKSRQWEKGWEAYESRWRYCQTPRADIPAPLWTGEDLHGRRILLHTEQGLGDSLQFIRFATSVAALGAHVFVEAPPQLRRLFQHVQGVAEVASFFPTTATFDYHCPLASLPYRLGVIPEQLPRGPYLSVPPSEAEAGKQFVRELAKPRAEDVVVGLVWSGNPRPHKVRSHAMDRRRSISLDDLAPLFGVASVRFVSFQMGEAARQLQTTSLPVVNGMAGVRDFEDTAARLMGVDLLICVDTSVAHLAGGLGLPVWMLSRFDGCWRWMEERDDTPWYPTLRIFRQSVPGEWSDVIDALRAGLVKRVARQPEKAAESRTLMPAT
ncbi:hypothetical protein AA0472_0295 [Acetobacter estunensis NRIC 0472]|uniref:Tetratricopeptide repeat protein n=1 Tax=Acetobacter estunensis TaxID=104097 RepID=A0A967B5H9_9PROT|nr:tetratricopeptide repeat protein [Acetobacter estunensis]NHO53609.1 tetratricopeptide repeat protein [Acetobacter estunensis]GBQ20945.1 hypothetical protein AA0472_0295 [Acetobacter estunensis NRIC 0472]